MRRKELDHDLIRSYISEALLQLLSKKSFESITISDIVKRAGVHRATFYRHFKSREEVIHYCLSNILSSSEDLKNDPAIFQNDKSSEKYMLKVFIAFYNNKKDLLLIYNTGLSYILLDVLKEYFMFDSIKDYLDDEGSKVSKEKYLTAFRIGGIYASMLLWFSHDMKESPEEMTRISKSI